MLTNDWLLRQGEGKLKGGSSRIPRVTRITAQVQRLLQYRMDMYLVVCGVTTVPERLRSFIVFLPLSAIVILSGCGKKDQVMAAASPGGHPPAAPVIVANVEQRDIPIQVRAIGNVEAYQTVQIRSQVNGQIERIFFRQGDDVRKSQLLFQLDKRPFQADLEKAVAQESHDQASAENSRIEAERYTRLEKQGIVSHEQGDQMRAQAKADGAAVEADKAAVDAARVQLQYTDIAAPIDARAGALLINLGNLEGERHALPRATKSSHADLRNLLRTRD